MVARTQKNNVDMAQIVVTIKLESASFSTLQEWPSLQLCQSSKTDSSQVSSKMGNSQVISKTDSSQVSSKLCNRTTNETNLQQQVTNKNTLAITLLVVIASK